MINLLPPDVKDSYHYARRNVRLVRWTVALACALVGLAALSAGGMWYLRQATNDAQAQATLAEETLQKQNQKQIQKEVKDISDSVKLAVQVLSKEVLFSKLLQQIAVVTPSNAKLANLNISQTQGAIDISAVTTDYNAATQLQLNLADPNNKIFSKADIVNINCATPTSGAAASAYPCTVTIRALFATNNPYLFISNPAKPAKATP